MLSKVFIGMIRLYQKVFSPEQGMLVRLGVKRPSPTCVFVPSCSEYMIGAIQKRGVVRGVWRGIRRIFRCRPGQTPMVDRP